jgi:hypothetical protein
MTEFLSAYGLWIVLAAIFVVMRQFGAGCCGPHQRHGGHRTHVDPETGPDRTADKGSEGEPARRYADR